MADGRVVRLFSRVREEIVAPPPPDYKKNYAHLVLETGMIYKYMLDLIKFPSEYSGNCIVISAGQQQFLDSLMI